MSLAVVIGAGIVGLHAARVLREKGHEVFVLEAERRLGHHTSGRNSGVRHAGIFYPADSFKERSCIEGNRKTLEWLEKLNVPHSPCGKWIVPETGQEGDLEPFFERIRRLPIPTPEWVSRSKLAFREPALRPSDAIFISSTGILDAASYVNALDVYIESLGVQVIRECLVTGVRDHVLETTRGEMPFDVGVNSAGLHSDEVARMTGLNDYTIKPCRGDYYVLNSQPVSRPVYHLPYKDAYGLGVHLTPTMDGQTLLGPNALFIDEKDDYRHKSPSEGFEAAVRFYLPGLKDFKITEGYSGNRPKLYKDGQPVNEVRIEKKANWVHILGAESPCLTAAPVLAEEVMKLI